jgi:hypothetical protein
MKRASTGHDTGDPGDVEFRQIDAVARIGEVFDEQAGGGEITDRPSSSRR